MRAVQRHREVDVPLELFAEGLIDLSLLRNGARLLEQDFCLELARWRAEISYVRRGSRSVLESLVRKDHEKHVSARLRCPSRRAETDDANDKRRATVGNGCLMDLWRR